MTDKYIGIDYGRIGQSNRNIKTGIHYGCISINDLADWIYEELMPFYPDEIEIDCECGESYISKDSETRCDHCESNTSSYRAWDNCESVGLEFNPSDKRYEGIVLTDMNDLLITESPYYTHAGFCSPCVPGACSLDSPCTDGPRCYCLGKEYFEGEIAPYPIYSVETGLLVK